MDNHRLQLLQNMPIFGALSESALDFIQSQCSQKNVAAGDAFFLEGDDADSLFILEQGEAQVRKQCSGTQRELRQLHPGDCFGEMSLIDLCPRSASVFAISDCQALELTNAGLFRLFEFDVEQFALIQMNLLREVSRRLRDLDERLSHSQPEFLDLVKPT